MKYTQVEAGWLAIGVDEKRLPRTVILTGTVWQLRVRQASYWTVNLMDILTRTAVGSVELHFETGSLPVGQSKS